MRRLLTSALLGSVLLTALMVGACSLFQNNSPAQLELASCDTYATTLTELATLRANKKLSATQVKYIDSAMPGLDAICNSPPPDVSKSALDTALDAGVKALSSIVIQVKGS